MALKLERCKTICCTSCKLPHWTRLADHVRCNLEMHVHQCTHHRQQWSLYVQLCMQQFLAHPLNRNSSIKPTDLQPTSTRSIRLQFYILINCSTLVRKEFAQGKPSICRQKIWTGYSYYDNEDLNNAKSGTARKVGKFC